MFNNEEPGSFVKPNLGLVKLEGNWKMFDEKIILNEI